MEQQEASSVDNFIGASPERLTMAARQLRVSEKLRARDIAERLGVGEGALLAARTSPELAPSRYDDEGERVVRLVADFAGILRDIAGLGRVMALTRNNATVHERYGVYGELREGGGAGLILGSDIDLRLFFHEWSSTYAVSESGPKGMLHSLQFFDRYDDAVHKVYLGESGDWEAYVALLSKWRAPDQVAVGVTRVDRRPDAPQERDDAQIDADGFHQAWRAMTDTHQFFGLLKRFDVSRRQALRLGPSEYVERLLGEPEAILQAVVGGAAREAVPIMVFVGNPGLIQIHTGPVTNIRMMGSWFNVLDPEFNLHMNLACVTDVYVVKKPTDDGVVSSLELFDREGRTIAMLFGARKPGQPERDAWRALLASALIVRA